MVNLQAAVCVAVELCCVILKGVSNTLFIPFISIKVDKMLETPLSVMQYTSTASKMTIKLNQQNLNMIYCMAVALDYISFS